MDSVCSAYAYSVLKNKIDEDNEYIPVMLGKGNRNTVKVFSSLGLEMPMYLHDVRPRVAAVQRKPVTSVKSSDPLFMLMDIFQRLKPSVVPVIDEDGYKALLSADDINAFFLRENRSGARQLYLLSEDNIERTIEGEYVKRSGSDVLRAPYMVGAMEYQVYLERLGRCVDKPVLVIGNRPKHLRAAVEHQLPGIVVTGVSAPSELKIDFSSFHHSLCIVDVHASHADLTDDYAAIPTEMKEVAHFFGKEFLREVSEEEFKAHIPELREKMSDRCVIRALHFFKEDARVEKAVSALKNNDFDTFKSVIKSSGDSSYKYLQNIYSNHDETNQAVSIALGLSEDILGNKGVCRVHGGGFAGTIQAFVEDDYVETYKTEIEKYFGEGSCHILKVRKYGGKKVEL